MYKNELKLQTRMEVEEVKVNVSEIARRTGQSPKTVKKYIDNPELHYQKQTRKKRGSKIDPYTEIIIDKFENYACNAKDIYHFLKKKYGYDGSYDLIKKFLKEHKETSLKKATIRVETTPGLQGQIDWKERVQFTNRNGEVITVNIFLFVMSYSSFRYIELTLDRKQPTLFNCMLNAFEYVGGVPKEIWFDNMSTVVDSHDINTGIVKFNDDFLDFAKVVSFNPIACRPYRPQTKGRAECLAKLMNRLRPYNEEFDTVEELSAIVKEVNIDINNEVSQATFEKPSERILKEKEHLFPVVPSEIREQYKPAKYYKVTKESMINYKKKKYSVPVQYISQSVTVKVIDNVLHIYYNLELIATHPIIENKRFNYRKEDIKEILKSDVYKKLDEQVLDKKADDFLKKYDEVK